MTNGNLHYHSVTHQTVTWIVKTNMDLWAQQIINNWEGGIRTELKIGKKNQIIQSWIICICISVNNVQQLTTRSHGEQIDAAPATGVFSPSSPRYLTCIKIWLHILSVHQMRYDIEIQWYTAGMSAWHWCWVKDNEQNRHGSWSTLN